MKRIALLLAVLSGCATAAAPTQSPAAATSALSYRSTFNQQPCAPAQITCPDRKAGDPCAQEGERCVRSCATEVLECVRTP